MEYSYLYCTEEWWSIVTFTAQKSGGVKLPLLHRRVVEYSYLYCTEEWWSIVTFTAQKSGGA